MATRQAEADEFYAEVVPPGTTDEEARIARQAFAGLLWSRQFYRYDVDRWIDGDPGEPPPPPGRGEIRNGGWRHLDANDVIVMPDTWEYPWFASWDLAFHCVALAHVDPALAKQQLLLLTREWYQHPNGQLPGLRVGLLRRQPAGARVGGDARVRDRRRHRPRVPRPDDAQAAASTSRGGSTARTPRATTCSRAASSASTTSGRSTARSRCPAATGSSRATARPGWRCTASTCSRSPCVLGENDHTYEDLAVKFLEHFTLHRRGHERVRPLGRGRRLLLRRRPPARRHHPARPGALDGRAHPDGGGGGGRRIPRRADAGVLRPDHVVPRPSLDPRRPHRSAWRERSPTIGVGTEDRTGGDGVGRRAPIGCVGCSPACSTPTSSSRRTGCARCRNGTPSTRSPWRSTGCRPRSTTNRPRAAPGSSAATPTGGDRCGSRSTSS